VKVLLFGATGMIGQGVLRECLAAPDVEAVLAVGRSPTGVAHPKLRERTVSDVSQLEGIAPELAGHDACFFCLGVSSAGMSEADYRRVTHDLTLSVARTLVGVAPDSTFVYVSGAGSGGRSMWARVKGETEQALLALPFRGRFMFRPGFIQPLDGIRSRTRLYRALYAVMGPLAPLLGRAFPSVVTDTRKVGRAMLAVARRGCGQGIVEGLEINALGGA